MARKTLMTLAAFALVVAACGGGDTASTTTTAPPDDTTTTTTSQATTTSEATTTTTTTTTTTAPPVDAETLGALLSSSAFDAQSARFDGSFRFTTDESEGLPPEMVMEFSGAFNGAEGSAQFTFDFGNLLGGLGEEIPPGFDDLLADPLELRVVDGVAYMKWGFLSFFTGPDIEWVELPEADAEDFVSNFSFGAQGSSPLSQIEQLADAGADVTPVGTETIRGVETTQYEVIVDVETFAAGLPDDEAEELRNSFGEVGLDAVTFNMFVGGEGLLYRFSFTMDASTMEGAEGIEELTVTYDIYDYGADIVIEAPPPETVTSGDALGGLFGG